MPAPLSAFCFLFEFFSQPIYGLTYILPDLAPVPPHRFLISLSPISLNTWVGSPPPEIEHVKYMSGEAEF